MADHNLAPHQDHEVVVTAPGSDGEETTTGLREARKDKLPPPPWDPHQGGREALTIHTSANVGRPKVSSVCPVGDVEFPKTAAHSGRMIDRWNEQLRCPICRYTGMVTLSQARGDATPAVESVPDGFKAVATEYGPDFHCATCDIAVEP